MKHRSRSDWDALTLRALPAVVGLLALGAFTLSFDALRELAIMAGLRPKLAFLWPLIVDGFIVVATAAAVVMRDRSRKQTWYPWATLVLFASISVIGNALHARSTADTTQVAVTVAAIVSAVPAIALLLASHLFVLVLDTPRLSTTATESVTTVTSSGRTTAKPPTSPPTMVTPPSTTSDRKHESVGARPNNEWTAWISTQLAQGRDLTGADVAEQFRVSPATGRRRLAAVKSASPTELPPSAGTREIANAS